jgi:hypothetical protein
VNQHWELAVAKTDPHQILKLIVSKNENERISAANRLFEACERKEWHPDDWRPQKNGRTERLPPVAEAMWQAKLATVERARQIAEIKLESAQELAQRVKERAEREHKAREKAEADVEKLKEQLNKAKAKAKPGPTRTVDLLSSLLPGGVLDALSADEVADKITALQREKGNRKHNETAQVDLLLGQLTKRLHDIWDEMFGPGSETPRKRGDSNTPTVTQFVQQYAGKSASWCQRCLSAFEHVFSEEWPEIEVRLDGSVSIENILKAARDPNRPMVRRISKVQKRLDALTEAVRRRAIDEAVDLIETWESEVQQKQA